MTCEREWRTGATTKQQGQIGASSLIQKCSLNRYILITPYFSWHKLKRGLFSNLVIQPEIPGNADNEEHNKCGHVSDCPLSAEETGTQQSMCSI